MPDLDVFERIARRRRRFERFLPLSWALGIATLYSYIRWNDQITTRVVFFIWFTAILINQAYVWNIFGGIKRTNYKPKTDKRKLIVYSILLIAILELSDLILPTTNW